MTIKSILILFFFTTTVFAQEAVLVTDQTIKIGGIKEEELYFGFAKGDKIIFSFTELDGKILKEVEIAEYPNNTKFSDFKTMKVENKEVMVLQQGVYVFRFKNSALGARVCQIKIERIPESEETRSFNSTVSWESKQETTYKTYTKDAIVSYDTTYEKKIQKVLVKTENKEILIFDKPQRVHSKMNRSSNKTSLSFTLPLNQTAPYKTTKVVSWAYWVGVGEEANQSWKQNIQLISKAAQGVAAYFTTPLGAFAVGAVTELAIPKIGEIVYYAIADQKNKDSFLAGNKYTVLDEGKGVAGFMKFTDPALCQGTYSVLLSNENRILGINAIVKVIAIVETNTYQDQQYNEAKVTPRYGKKTFSEPVINIIKVPVTGL